MMTHLSENGKNTLCKLPNRGHVIKEELSEVICYKCLKVIIDRLVRGIRDYSVCGMCKHEPSNEHIDTCSWCEHTFELKV